MSALIQADECAAILADMKQAWEALASVAMQTPGAAEIVGPRATIPPVVDMVFEQAAQAASAQSESAEKRRDGHSALRVRDGKLETFDPHPESAPSKSERTDVDDRNHVHLRRDLKQALAALAEAQDREMMKAQQASAERNRANAAEKELAALRQRFSDACAEITRLSGTQSAIGEKK